MNHLTEFPVGVFLSFPEKYIQRLGKYTKIKLEFLPSNGIFSLATAVLECLTDLDLHILFVKYKTFY